MIKVNKILISNKIYRGGGVDVSVGNILYYTQNTFRPLSPTQNPKNQSTHGALK